MPVASTTRRASSVSVAPPVPRASAHGTSQADSRAFQRNAPTRVSGRTGIPSTCRYQAR